MCSAREGTHQIVTSDYLPCRFRPMRNNSRAMGPARQRPERLWRDRPQRVPKKRYAALRKEAALTEGADQHG